jgi:Flp pilus assembly pilin Flp
MSFFKDESGQGAAEYILLFGGVIVVAIAALYLYFTYIEGVNPLNAAGDINQVRQNVNQD